MKKLLLVSALLLSFTASPCFAVKFCKDVLEPGNPGGTNSLKTWDDEWIITGAGEVEIDIWVNDLPEPLITAGCWIEYDASQMSIVSATINIGDGGWDSGMSNTVAEPQGPGTYLVTVGNLTTVSPDADGDIHIVRLRFNCEENCDGEITVDIVPNFDSVVGNGAGVYDSQIDPNTFTIEQGIPTTTTTISVCNGSEDVCIRIGDGSGVDGSTENPVTISMENMSDREVRGIQLEVCDEGDILTFTGGGYETSEGCAGILQYSGVEEGTISTLYYDVKSNVLPGQCVPIKATMAVAADYSRPAQVLKIGVDSGEFCITAFPLPVIEIQPSKVWKSRWIPLPYLMIITGKEINSESFVNLSYYPDNGIFSLPPIVWNKHYIWSLIWVMPGWMAGMEDRVAIASVITKDGVLEDHFDIMSIGQNKPSAEPEFGSISPNNWVHESVMIGNVEIIGIDTNFQDESRPVIDFDPPEGLSVENINVVSNTKIEFDLTISANAPVGFKDVTVIYDGGNKLITGVNVFEVYGEGNTTTTTIPAFCGDVWPPPSSPEAMDCGDGVVDDNDATELADLLRGIADGTRELTNCQLLKGDVPNGMPPYCGNPADTGNCESDGDIGVFDMMVVIDKALDKPNCCDYCDNGNIF